MDIDLWKGVSTLAQAIGTIFTIAIGAFVAYVAWQQWQTAKRKVDLDLFERRLEVYSETRSFTDSIVVNKGTTSEALLQFLNGTNTAYFLFGTEIRGLLADLYERSKDIGLPPDQRESEHSPRIKELLSGARYTTFRRSSIAPHLLTDLLRT